jgi:aspartyl aminopeptidase
MLDETKQVIVNINGNFTAKEAFDVMELCFTVGNAVFPSPNKYQLTFHVDGETIGSRILVLDKVQIGG